MPQRILIVEDSRTQADALQAMLQEQGYAVTVASRGEQALALVPNEKFDLVISDIVMPGISGYDVCRRIKIDLGRADLPVVLLTSLNDPTDIVRGLECGADNFLTKPYHPDQLLDRVQHVLRNRTARRPSKVEVGVTLTFLGSTFTISSGREQILDLLVTTYEDAVIKNRELRQREEELQAAKTELARYAGSLEQRLESVLENVPDVLFSMTVDGTAFHYVSPASTQVLAITPEQLLADATQWQAAIHQEDQAMVVGSHQQAAQSGRPETVEYRVHHPDGVLRWIERTFIPVVDAEGTVDRLDGIARDITEKRKLQEQFRQAQKMEAVGRLAGGIAHDFNNLLTVISSYSDMLLEDLDPEDARREDLEAIQKAGRSAAGLTRQLLAFSRQQVLEPRLLDVNAVVTSADMLLQRLLGEDVELITALQPQLGTVRADPGQLEQVIVNLAVNARDAMPDGGKLTIETANADMDEEYAQFHPPAQPGRFVMFAVSDTGSGMDAQTQARIFEPFFTTKEVGKGTGLGLATVYGIVKQSGGFIWLYSELGQGTTFKVYLPRVDEAAEAVTPPAALEKSRQATETLLLVDDDAAIRTVARKILERLGYTILEAASGEAAVQMATEHQGPIHLLLTDVVMPLLGGRQLAGQLEALRPDVKVLYASGYPDDAVVRHGVLEPGVAYLQKPFTPEDLARKVREVLDRES